MEKSFLKNTFYSIIYKVINVIFPFVLSIYTARVLMAEGIGKVASAQNIVAYFTILAAMGLPNYGIKAIASQNNIHERSKVFWELFYLNALSTTICLLSYYFLIFQSGYFEQEQKLYLVAGVSIILNYVNVDWFYYGCEKFSYITIRSCAVKFLSLILIILFVKEKSDYILYTLITCIAIAGNNIVNIFYLRTRVKKICLCDIQIKQHLRPVLLLLLISISVEFYTLLDITMLSAMCESDVVGYYYNASKLVKIGVTLLVSIGGALLPRLTYHYSRGAVETCEKLVASVTKVLIFLSVPCGIGLFEIAPTVVCLLYGESFIDAIPTVRIMSLLFFCLSFSNLFGTQILLTVGQEKKLLFSTILGVIINVTLNILWIPLYRQNGAATASVLSEAVVTISTCLYAKKYFKFKINFRFILNCIISGMTMGVMVMFVEQFNFKLWIQTGLDMIVGVSIYIGSNMAIHNMDFIKKNK